jgi:hypothetical protein
MNNAGAGLYAATTIGGDATSSIFNALNPTADIVSYANLITAVASNNGAKGGEFALRPELFYTKQLLETIRLGADQYPYYKIAETSPIPDKSKKLQLRRWAPLQAHTTPLAEGIPPVSDKGSMETYEIDTYAYGRYMEFTDRVDLDVVDPVIATYTKEYSIVAVETLDLLAREALISVANQDFAGQAAKITDLTLAPEADNESRNVFGPSIEDLRLIVLTMKKQLVRPRLNGKFTVICSPEFVYDMITDPYVEKYMRYNNTTKPMYENSALVPMFDMEFAESMATLNSGEYTDENGKRWLRLFRTTTGGAFEYVSVREDFQVNGKNILNTNGGYVKDSRTLKDASYFPDVHQWDIAGFNAATSITVATEGTADAKVVKNASSAVSDAKGGGWKELKVHHCIIVGKDALIRTGMSGQDNAQMYVKPKGSAGVIDPIDQRQSIGFKINSVGFGSARPEAVHDYQCIPSTLNM